MNDDVFGAVLMVTMMASTFVILWLRERAEQAERRPAAPADVARELTAQGFSEHHRQFVHPDGRRVVVEDQRATVIIPMRQAPFGAFPVEEDADFADDGILVHFQAVADLVQPNLQRAERLRDLVERAGAWHRAARLHGLRFRFASGLRHIDGEVDGIDVRIRQNGNSADVLVSVSGDAHARRGSGDSGNPVLDLLIDSHGIPDDVVEPVLDVVHGRRGVIEQGALRVRWEGDIEQCLETVLAVARGLPPDGKA